MISHRCGISTDKCSFACSVMQSDSRCTKYIDRRDCSISMQQRKKSARHSRIINKERKFIVKYIK